MLPLQEGFVYGPVRSRRLGHSLGVNILPRNQKTCSLNCSYCQYGWTKTPVRDGHEVTGPWPSPASIAKAVAAVLPRFVGGRERLDHLTLAGNGEPTLHPQFPEVVAELRGVRDAHAPGLPLAVLSNSTTLQLPGVAAALDALDERYMKLDAGETALLRRLNAGTSTVDEIVAGLQGLKPVVVQSLFVRDRLGRIDNATDLAVATWIAAVAAIKPAAVHIYSIDRAPALPFLQAVPLERLEEIARRARAAGLEAKAYSSGEGPRSGGR
jgi:wyosine [tRNA(Phe)-imidazoG37] synthetase (radical SAM superfamily)